MKTACLLTLLLLCIAVQAQRLGNAVNFPLNASFTYMLSQDEKGFIWIGSDNGLFRFDGYEFRHFNYEDGLKNPEVLSAIVLKNDELLITPLASRFYFYKQGRILDGSALPQLDRIKTRKEGGVTTVSLDKGVVYIYNTLNPEAIFIVKDLQVRTVEIPPFLHNKNLGVLEYDPSGTILFHNERTIYEYKIRTGQFQHIYTYPPPFAKGSYSYWLARGLYALNSGKQIALCRRTASGNMEIVGRYAFESEVYTIIKRGDLIWVLLAGGGAYCLDLLHPGKKPEKFLPEHIINDVIADRDGNIWFSSRSNGLFFLRRELFTMQFATPDSIVTGHVTTVGGNAKTIVLGFSSGEAGIFRNGRFTRLIPESREKFDMRCLAVNDTLAILALNSKRSFTLSLPTLRLNPLSDRLVIKDLSFLSKKEVIISTSDSLYTYNLATGRIRSVIQAKSYTLAPLAGDSILLGSFADLFKLNLSTGQKSLLFRNCYLTDLKMVKPGLFAGASSMKGILLFDNQKIVRILTEGDGLASNQVKRLFIENDSTLWAATNAGISRVALTARGVAVNTFTKMEGLPSDRVSDCFIRNDTAFVGTIQGLAVLPVKRLLRQGRFIDIKVSINSVVVGGKRYLEPTGLIRSPFSMNPITLNLSFPDYHSLGNVSYRYKISGLSEGWQTSTSSDIYLNAIPPGSYTIIIYGIGYNGKRSRTYSSVNLEIIPQFWQTLWFRALALLALISIISYGIWFFLQRERNKRLRRILYEKRIAELELQALKAQMNPHFVYNCLNSIKYLLYVKDYQQTEGYLDAFTEIIRKTLHYSEKTFISVREELEYLNLYLAMERLRFEERFQFDIHVQPTVRPEWDIPSLLVQPFVENAIKHGMNGLDRDGKIGVGFNFEDKTRELVISIEDNGKGIDPQHLAGKAGSFGIRLSQKRIETFRQIFDLPIRLEVSDLRTKGGFGTRITIYMPIQ